MSGRWLGKCPGLGASAALVEELHGSCHDGHRPPSPSKPVATRSFRAEDAARIPTGIYELDRVLGGGLVPGLARARGRRAGGGEVDAAAHCAPRDLTDLEASAARDRRGVPGPGKDAGDRLGGAGDVEILAETQLQIVCATLEEERPDVCVIDRVQTLYASELGSAPGSVAQVREAAARSCASPRSTASPPCSWAM